ncbi:MAG: phage major capsid protein [Candidatus Margulisbacteria bacterium]|nr:phage major capsid protein [Candidatus Margulisiibacteriota bacterium]
MGVPQATIDLDTLYSATWDALLETKAIDLVYEATPLTYFLLKAGNIRSQVGGTNINVRLMYGKNTTTRFLRIGDQMSVEKAEIITQASYDWKYGGTNIVRHWQHDQQNAGKSQIADMVLDDINNAKASLMDILEEKLIAGDGTGDDGRDPDGLQNIVSVTPNVGVVGNLDAAIYPWWRNRLKVSGGIGKLLTDTANLINTCSRGGAGDTVGVDRPNLAITDQTTYELYQQELVNMYKLVPTDVNIPFPNVGYFGMPIMWSAASDVNKGELRLLNTKYLRMVADPTYQFAMTDWKQSSDVINDRMAQIMLVFNLICSNRPKQGVITGITSI